MKKYLKLIICLIMLMLISCEEKLPEPIAVTAVSLNAETVEMTEGDELTLIATVSPKDADNKSVIWSSSNLSIASVVDGKVMAHKPGRVTITVKTDDGGKIATCEVTVKEIVSDKDISVEDYQSAIVGWWKYDNQPTDNRAYSWVFNFKGTGYVDTFDNHDSDGYSEILYQVQPTWFYWIEDDFLYDQQTRSDYPEGSCGEFGNPECECNTECDEHNGGMCHYTKIRTLTSDQLVIELNWCDEKEVLSFHRIEKPLHLEYQ